MGLLCILWHWKLQHHVQINYQCLTEQDRTFCREIHWKKREKLIKIPSTGIFCLIFVHFEISIYKSAGVIESKTKYCAWNCAMVFNQTKNGRNRENKPLTV